MGALILFFVLFFPGISPWTAQAAQVIPFSAGRELGRLLIHTLPSLALMLYIIYRERRAPDAVQNRPETPLPLVPRKQDLLPFAIGLPVLISIGFFVAFLISVFAQAAAPLRVEGPYNAAGWAAVILVCLGTGYLEEIYFRYYLLDRMENLIPQTAARVGFSVVLFALCHLHDGPWGLLNAALAGVFLSALFLRYRSLHGIALAHAGYNMFVYFMGTMG